MATHPPLDERIKRIDPAFDGTFPVLPEDTTQYVSAEDARLRPPIDALALAGLTAASRERTERVTRRIGQSVQVRYAAGVLDSLPPALRDAATDPLNATALTFALVLHPSDEVRNHQLQKLRTANAVIAQQTETYAGASRDVDTRTRLPLLNLCLPALRTLSRQQWEQFRSTLEELICCDAQVDLFEFVLRRIIERNINAHWKPKEAAVVQYYSFVPLAGDCAVLLSALARLGDSNAPAIQRAFDEGAALLPANLELPLLPLTQCGVEQIDAALRRLAASVPHIRKTVIEACARAVACDGEVKCEEAELLRAIAESLGCPIPPFVEGI